MNGKDYSITSKLTPLISNMNRDPITENIFEIMNEDEGPILITLKGSDIDGDRLRYIIVTNPEYGTATLINNIISYTPNKNYNGTDLITYRASDGQKFSNNSNIHITINNVNDNPITK